jgi:NAD(P)-dependent dehydrogenase (short-subunit alcohol dehydrogenase family)
VARASARLKSAGESLAGRVVLVTGGAGFLGPRHAEALASAGAKVLLADVEVLRARRIARRLRTEGRDVHALELDVTDERSVERALATTLRRHGRVDVLVNNAAHDPKVGAGAPGWSRLEQFSLERWNADLAVGLTGAFSCARVFGGHFAARGGGVIVNVASDLGLIAPDQRIYRRAELASDEQPVKPVSYPVAKAGLVMLTKYLATYWAEQNVRVNALCPGGVENGQDPAFVALLAQRIPMGRMARPHELGGALVFLCSDASSYVTGATLSVDGGRTAW